MLGCPRVSARIAVLGCTWAQLKQATWACGRRIGASPAACGGAAPRGRGARRRWPAAMVDPWLPEPPRLVRPGLTYRTFGGGSWPRIVVATPLRSYACGPHYTVGGCASASTCRSPCLVVVRSDRTSYSPEHGWWCSSMAVSGMAVQITARCLLPTRTTGYPSWRATASGTKRRTPCCGMQAGRYCAFGSTSPSQTPNARSWLLLRPRA
jgi:hypothetical protein